MKKFLAAVLAVVMVLALGTVAFAAESPVAEVPEEVPEVVEDAEEAVEAVSAETPVIAVATKDGFEAVVEGEDETVPVESVKVVSVAAAEEELSEEEYDQFVADITAVTEAEDKGAIVSAFWFSMDEDALGDAAKMINSSDDDTSALKYTFACVGTPRVYLNGKLLEVTMNEDGTYTVLLPEAGSVIIVVDAAE